MSRELAARIKGGSHLTFRKPSVQTDGLEQQPLIPSQSGSKGSNTRSSSDTHCHVNDGPPNPQSYRGRPEDQSTDPMGS